MREVIKNKVFFLVEGYLRASPDALTGQIIDTQACVAVQLSGVISRMLRNTAANMCVTVEISEEVFQLFYQEKENGRR